MNKQFNKFLFEGGNMSVVDADGNIIASAQSIDLKKFNRSKLSSEIIKLLKKINILYKNKFNEPLWENFKSVESGYSFSGSTEYIFDKNISDEEFIKYKPEIGDIDVIIDKNKAENFNKLMTSLTNKNIDINWELIGLAVGKNGKNISKDIQESYIFKYTQDDKSVLIQIDFEFQKFNNGIPDTWAKFSHSSSWKDLTEGIKGAFHKKLLEALVNTIGRDEEFLILTDKSPTDSIDNMKFKNTTITKRGALSKLSFTNDSGLRVKYIPVLDKNGNIFEKDGKKIYKELKPSESQALGKVERNVPIVFETIFNKKPTNSELNLFYSFTGLLDLIKKFIKDKNDIKFLATLFRDKTGVSDEGIIRSSKMGKTKEKDLEYRVAAWNKFNEVFPNSINIDKEIEKLDKYFYSKNF